ncbi:MAG: hypothetical protein ACXVUL_22045 [Solirubrobacteraceae bacterium]
MPVDRDGQMPGQVTVQEEQQGHDSRASFGARRDAYALPAMYSRGDAELALGLADPAVQPRQLEQHIRIGGAMGPQPVAGGAQPSEVPLSVVEDGCPFLG